MSINHLQNYTLIDRNPWLSLNSVMKYLDYKSKTSVYKFIKTNKDFLSVKKVNGQLRIKQSTIDQLLNKSKDVT